MNDHPNLNDLIAFVSMDTLNADALALSAAVNDALCREMNASRAAAALARTAHETETPLNPTEAETR